MNDIPEVDDFAHFFDQRSGTLWVFGGYMNGQKCNLFFKIDVVKGATIVNQDTHPLHPNSRKMPCQRSGSRMAFSSRDNCLYLFGGLNFNNQTLNDMWTYNLLSEMWEPIR